MSLWPVRISCPLPWRNWCANSARREDVLVLPCHDSPCAQEWASRGAKPLFASGSLTYSGPPHLGAHRNSANLLPSPRQPLALAVPGWRAPKLSVLSLGKLRLIGFS
jgi:hypothetical protein